MTRSLLVLVGFVIALAACDGADFDSPSQVVNLRILGLSSSAQVVEPGQPVTLEALWVDADEPPEGGIITAWFPACVNAGSGGLNDCLDELNDLRPAAGQAWPEEFSPVSGDRFDTQVSEEILDGRDEFGVQYFFFAVCRGARFEFAPSRHPNVPIVCRDASGDAVPQPSFRVGYRTLTALEGFQVDASKPRIIGFNIDGLNYDASCLDQSCTGYKNPSCEVESCPIINPCDPGGEEKEGDCRGGTFRVLVDPDSAGIDFLADQDELQSVEVWARYFTSQGTVSADFDLLHEREPFGQQEQWDRENQSGINDFSFGDLFLWAVVYDSMGNVSWGGISLRVEPQSPQ